MSNKVKILRVNGEEYNLSGTGSVDIVDNLETADSDSALSANQGKILNEKIDGIENAINSNLRLKMPNYNNPVPIVDTAINESYTFTATEDGWLHINVQSTNEEKGQLLVSINDKYSFVLCAPSGYLQQSQMIPIRKNDVVNCGLSSGRIRTITFIPCV